MQVIKATKRFRQVSLIGSLILAVASISIMIGVKKDCEGTSNLKAAVALVFILWSCIFVLLLLQVVGLVKCLKKIPKVLFGFYVGISVTMFLVQMLLFTTNTNSEAIPCYKQVPLLYYWLCVQVGIFYLIVAFGLATWGSYLCAVADVKEEVTRKAIDEYLAENKQVQKHFAIKAGTSTPLMLESAPRNDMESQQRMLMADQYS